MFAPSCILYTYFVSTQHERVRSHAERGPGRRWGPLCIEDKSCPRYLLGFAHGNQDLSWKLSLRTRQVRGGPRLLARHRQVQLHELLEETLVVDPSPAGKLSLDLGRGGAEWISFGGNQRAPWVLYALRRPYLCLGPGGGVERRRVRLDRRRFARRRRPEGARRGAGAVHERSRRRLVAPARRDALP